MSQVWILRVLAVLGLCLALTACGGGGGGGDDDVGEIIEPEPQPVDPTDVVDLDSLETYINAAKAAWANPSGRGLYEVIAELESEDNDPRYDYEQVQEFLLSLSEYQYVLGSHSFDGRYAYEFTHPFMLTNVYKAWAAGLTGQGCSMLFN